MWQAIEERVKYRHTWYRLEAISKNDMEAYREKDMKLVSDAETKAGIRKQLRG